MPPSSRSSERGVYTLANDAVIDWFQAFIRSFRKTNPSLPLTVIPYDQNISRLETLRDPFQFEIMDSSMCSQYDALADRVKVAKKGAGCFRKFACFFGSYRDFLFLDADIVTLVRLDRLFDAFSGSSSQFVHFDTAMDMCYSESLAAVMVPQYGSPGYNSGAFFSRSGLIAESDIFTAANKASAICDGFADCVEQPFFNYVTDTSRLKYADAKSLAPDLATVIWARQPLIYIRQTDTAKNSEGKPLPFIHWAGCAYPTMVRPELFLLHRTRGLSLPDRITYHVVFYFRRYRVYVVRVLTHCNGVIVKFFTSSAWRNFYLCKLIGIKAKMPT